MIAKRVLLIFALLVCSAAAGYFLYVKQQRDTLLASLRFDDVPSLELSNVDQASYNRLMILHQICFEGIREEKLTLYYTQRDGGELSHEMKSRIKYAIESSRKTGLRTFHETQDVSIIRSENKVLGLFNCVPEDKISNNSIMIYNVCLDPTVRGMGLGKKLMEHAIEKCKKPGRDLTLNVYKTDTDVIKLYEKIGFVIEPSPKPMPDEFYYFDKVFMIYRK